MRHFHPKPMGFGPSITTRSPLTSGVQGIPYSLTLNGTGGTPSYTYAIVSGTLDSGVSFSSAGVFSGTPSNAEADVLGIQITDANGLKSTVQLFSLTFLPTLFLAGQTLPTATNGVPYSQNIAGRASGGSPPYAFSLISATGPDSWFVDSLGNITGTPGTGGAGLVTDTGISLVTDTGVQLVT